MADKKGSARRGLSIRSLTELVRSAKLAWRLLLDKRISLTVKIIPLLGVMYLIWPIDLLPDLFPALGQLDDIAILLLALNWFIKASPSDVVEEIRGNGETISARYTVVDDSENA